MDPEDLGLDPSRLARIDRHFASYIERGLLPNCLVLIARRGAVGHLSVQGLADRERGTPLCDDTLFRIYSMTKPVTCVAMLMLFERGLFQLDDPVARFLPGFAEMRVLHADGRMEPARRPITIRDLFRHTSGLTYGFQNRTPVDALYRAASVDAPAKTLAEWCDELATLPLDFSPGEAWTYSVATDVLGRLVEVISGRRFDDFLRAEIFEALGMVDTDFHVPSEKLGRFAACYRLEGAGLVLSDDPRTSSFAAPPVFLSGGGGLVSTAADYLAFARMLLNGGAAHGVQLLSPATIALMSANHLPGGADLPALSRSLFSEAAYAGFGFGLGVSVMVDPARSGLPGNAGDIAWGGVANTYFWVDPKAQLIVIQMSQASPSSAYVLRRELRTMVYAALTD